MMGKKQKRRRDRLGCGVITVEVFFCAFEALVWSEFVGGGQSKYVKECCVCFCF